MDPIFSQPDLLNYVIAGETAGTWIIVFGIWALIAALLIAVRSILLSRFKVFAAHTQNRYDDVVVLLIRRTKVVFLVAVALLLASLIHSVAAGTLAWIARMAFLLFLVQIVFWGNSVIALYVQRYKEEKLETDAAAVTTMQAVGFLGRLLLLSTVVLMALDNLGFDITALVAGLGIGGIAVALAVQNILADLFASLSIVLDKPFVVGDFLILNEYMGTVEHVGLKTTRIRSLSGEQIVISNNDLLNSRIRNYKRMFERRVVFSIGVTYQTPYESMRDIPLMLRKIIEAQEMTRFDRAHFKNFGNSSLDFEAVYYVLSPDYNQYMDIQQAINLLIYKRFAEAGIEFAYPTQTLFLEKLPDEVTSGPNGGGRV
jgi:small-conductance mechanosensitive channel